MRRSLLLTALLSSAIGAAVLAASDRPATQPTTAPSTQQSADKPVNKFCAIEQDSEVDPKVTTVYKGKTIGFCCSSCIKEFNKDPEKFMAKLK